MRPYRSWSSSSRSKRSDRLAVVFKLLRQDITVIVAERKKGTPPLEVSEMRCNADRRALLLRSQESSKYVRILE